MKGIKIFLKKEKNKKRQYDRERYKILPEDKKFYLKILKNYKTRKNNASQTKKDEPVFSKHSHLLIC